jgi:hypothetical protein
VIRVLAAAALLLSLASPAFAQGEAPIAFDGPPPPALPATMVRDAAGKTTVRAVRLTTPLRIDGQLDEEVYSSTQGASDFIQTEPKSGAPATEKTEIWIFFDDDNVYFAVRASESQPEKLVVNEMRHDSSRIYDGDHIGVAFDTFFDKRNSVNFFVNYIGGKSEGEISNELTWNGDWNQVWDFKGRRTPEGWTGEAAIPFKSLRYRPGRSQVWGLQVRRINRSKNEVSLLTSVPPGLQRQAIFRVSRFATLVGIEAPPSARALDIKPSIITNVATDRSATPQLHNDVGADISLDVKYAVTRAMTGDFTVNTDFAQVEADEQQVNLTRYSLFFPEKRDFFLENRGIFNFGGIAGGTGDTPVIFYSRRIGLDQGRAIPIEAGGRLSGRVGKYTIGVLNIQTDDVAQIGVPGTNFAVARVRRDILRRSAIGLIATRRSGIVGRDGSGETYGADGAFAFYQNLFIDAYWARTQTIDVHEHDTSYRAQMDYRHDRYGVQLEHVLVGEGFDPQVGFLRRTDFRKSRAQLRFSPRPKKSFVRKYWFQAGGEYFENGAGIRETRELTGEFFVDFQSSDRVEVSYTDTYELIPQPFRIARGVTVPARGYSLGTLRGQMLFGQQRRITGTVFVEGGPFYDGNRVAFGYSTFRVNVNPRLSIEPALSINKVNLPFGDFTTKLVSARTTYTITPAMFVSGLVQYNSSNNSLSSNVRLRWEYRPGSELFVVYNDGRDTTRPGYPDLLSRSFVVKANRLLRF